MERVLAALLTPAEDVPPGPHAQQDRERAEKRAAARGSPIRPGFAARGTAGKVLFVCDNPLLPCLVHAAAEGFFWEVPFPTSA